jgi:FMN phosphatase YigB (HAD superfamily)
MTNKFICLDIGNVLCNVDEVGFLKTLSYKLNISTFKARRFLKRFQQIHDLGFTTMEDELMDQFDVKSPFILEEITPCYPMISAILDLNLKIALLSNIGVEHAAKLPQKLPGLYDDAIKHLSCFVGARKPSTLYFQSFLLQHPEFYGSAYVDDLQANLDGAAPLGFKTFRISVAEPDLDRKMAELYQFIKSANEPDISTLQSGV